MDQETSVEGRTLRILDARQGLRVLSFPEPIVETVEFAAVIVVRLEDRAGRNVYGVSRSGPGVWQVAIAGGGSAVCTSVVREGPLLRVFTEDGAAHLIDPSNGESAARN